MRLKNVLAWAVIFVFVVLVIDLVVLAFGSLVAAGWAVVYLLGPAAILFATVWAANHLWGGPR